MMTPLNRTFIVVVLLAWAAPLALGDDPPPDSHEAPAADKPAATPEAAVRRFLKAMASGDVEAIERAIVPNPNSDFLTYLSASASRAC
jgi:hypothetical protein